MALTASYLATSLFTQVLRECQFRYYPRDTGSHGVKWSNYEYRTELRNTFERMIRTVKDGQRVASGYVSLREYLLIAEKVPETGSGIEYEETKMQKWVLGLPVWIPPIVREKYRWWWCWWWRWLCWWWHNICRYVLLCYYSNKTPTTT